MKKVRANMRFQDSANHSIWRSQGEEWIVSDERAWILTQTMFHNRTYYCDYAEIPWDDKKGPRILIYNYDLYKIGGTETFLYNLCKYYKDKNIVLVYKTGKPEYINLLQNLVPVFRDDGIRRYTCDVLLMGNYFGSEVCPRVTAKQKYQMVHADYTGMKEAGWKIQLKRPDKTKFISVSDTTAGGLKREFGYDSIVQYNILDKEIDKDKPLVFISLTRATREKGIDRIIKLCQLFKKYNKKFVWLLCGTIAEQCSVDTKKQIDNIPEIILISPSPNNKLLINTADYLVQLSDTESFCYSAYEALIMGKPVIITDFPESKNIVKQGKNGYIISRNTDKYNKALVDKIFDKIPTEITYVDRCDYDLWEKIFSGEDVQYERKDN
jgi:glycosyltransferase involved in cell wall biosynthesis